MLTPFRPDAAQRFRQNLAEASFLARSMDWSEEGEFCAGTVEFSAKIFFLMAIALTCLRYVDSLVDYN